MIWLWSYEELAKICRNKKGNPALLEWATSRLYTLYPEQARELLVELLLRGDQPLATKIVGLLEPSEDPFYLEPLRKAYLRYSGEVAGKIASKLFKMGDTEIHALFQQKYLQGHKKDTRGYMLSLFYLCATATPFYQEKTIGLLHETSNQSSDDVYQSFLMCIMAGHSMASLIAWCVQKTAHFTHFPALLQTMATFCGYPIRPHDWDEFQQMFSDPDGLDSDFPGDDLSMEFGEENFPSILAKLHNLLPWDNPLSLAELFQKKQYAQIISVIEHQLQLFIERKKAEVGEDQYARWDLLITDFPNICIHYMVALHAQRDRIPMAYQFHGAFIMALLFFKLLEVRDIVGHQMTEKSSAQILDFFLQERGSTDQDSFALTHLRTAPDRDTMVKACFERLESIVNPGAQYRIIDLLCLIGTQDIAFKLFDVSCQDRDLYEDIASLLLKLEPSVVMEFLQHTFLDYRQDRDRVLCALLILKKQPAHQSVQLLLEHWRWLWVDYKYDLIETLIAIAAEDFIAPIKKEINEYDEPILALYKFLCLIHQVQDPAIAKVEKKMKELQRKKKQRMDILQKSYGIQLLKYPHDVELECRGCARIHGYQVKHVQYCFETDDLFIQDPITCPHCSAFNHYALTFETEEELADKALLLAEQEDGEDASGLTISLIDGLQVEGQVLSIEDALDYSYQLLEKEPENLYRILLYANLLIRCKYSEKALPFLSKCIQVDPKAVEAYITLGELLHSKGDEKRAYAFYWEALKNMDTGNYYLFSQNREAYIHSFYERFIQLAKEHGAPILPALLKKQ